MARPDNFFEVLAGVPVHYDRLAPPFGYGTRGKPAKFYCLDPFETELNECFQELWDICPLGQAEVIASAGAWVEKPGFHGQGRAFDIDGIFWAGKGFVTLHDGFQGGDRVFYYAVEAIVRRHFGTVLDYNYDIDHRDHLHLDDGTAIGFQPGSPSRVKFLQGALTHVYELPVKVDGDFGPQTEQAVATALGALGIAGGIDNVSVWKEFLIRTAEKGFGIATGPVAEKNPLELLHDVYAAIDRTLTDTGLRKQVEGTLNAFANHDETQAWLNQYR